MTAERFFALYEKVRERYNLRARNHLRIQLEAVSCEVERLARDIQNLTDSQSAAVNEYAAKALESAVKLKMLSDELGQPFLMFVVGAGKAGKSTIINALLGKEVAEVGKVPKTWKVDVYFGSGNQERVEIRYRDGTSCFKPYKEVKSILLEEEEKRKASEATISIERDKFIAQNATATPELLEEKQKELQKAYLYRSPIVEVRWPYVAEGFLEKFRLVDTPGLKQEGFFENIAENASEYYSKADGVIWLLSADVVADKGPREEIEKIITRFGNHTGNIIAVLNQIDKVRKNGGDKAVGQVLKNAHEKFGNLFQEIIPFSAQEALEGALKIDNQKIEASGMKLLKAAIERRFVTKSQTVQVTSKITGAYAILAELFSESRMCIDRLNNAEAQRKTHQLEWEEDIEALRNQCKKSLTDSFDQQIAKVRRNAKNHENTYWDLPKAQRQDFINRTICESTCLESVLERYRQQRYNRLVKMIQVHKRKSAFAEFPLLAASGLLTKPDLQAGKLRNMGVSANSINSEGAEWVVGGGAALAACAVAGPIGMLAFFVIGTDLGKSLVQGVTRFFSDLSETLVTKHKEYLMTLRHVLDSEDENLFEAAKKEVDDVRERTFACVYAPAQRLNAISERIDQIACVSCTKFELLDVKDVVLGKPNS